MDRLRTKLAEARPAFGMFVSLESASSSEIAAELGVDWLVVDLEHGHLSYKDVLDHIRAVRGSGTTVLVRVPIAAQDTIKRVLESLAPRACWSRFLFLPRMSSEPQAGLVTLPPASAASAVTGPYVGD